MKVLTLNCWGTYGPPGRLLALAQAIRRLKADILCLQEATIPGLLESLDYPTCLQAPETGLAILSRFPAVEHLHIPYRTISPLEEGVRGVLLASLQVGSADLWVGTTHLSWKEADNVSRLGQTAELLKITAAREDRILLGGDFNATPDQEPIRLMSENRFVDLFYRLHPEDPGTTWDNQNPFIQSHSVRFPDRRIDFLFLHKETARWCIPSRCDIVCRQPDTSGFYPSDHYGVLATLDLS